MAVFNKFNIFAEDLAEGVHDLDNDQLSIYLSNTAPSASADTVKTDLAEIATGNGYTGPINLTLSSSSQTGGTYTLAVNNLTPAFTATGAVATFRYVVVYNSGTTAKVDPLIGWYDIGSAQDLVNGQEFNITFTSNLLQIV